MGGVDIFWAENLDTVHTYAVVRRTDRSKAENKLERAVGPATSLYHRPMTPRISNFASIQLIEMLARTPLNSSGKSAAIAVYLCLRFIQLV
jgi:hypothetical protein